MKVHHIGYLVKNIEKAEQACLKLGYKKETEIIFDESRGINISFLIKDAYRIELVSPATDVSVISSLRKRIGNSPYHICYEADCFEEDLKALEANGFMRINIPAPAPAISNRTVCFLQNPFLGMIELLGEA